MSEYCDDCGCRVYDGACTNCEETIYIADQYDELDMPLPPDGSQFITELIWNQHRQMKRLMLK